LPRALGPLFLRQAGDARNFRDKFFGQLGRFVEVAPRHNEQAGIIAFRRQAAVLALGGFQQTRGFVTREHLVRNLR
jgi:hypothetical protein